MRLIDADELINDINNGLWDWDEVQNITGVTVLKQMISDIQNTKTVDAVPVIRCKDCKHWDNENDIGWCDIHSNFSDDEWTMFDADDFCSAGERREDE